MIFVQLLCFLSLFVFLLGDPGPHPQGKHREVCRNPLVRITLTGQTSSSFMWHVQGEKGDVVYDGCTKMECVKKGKKMKWLKSPSKYVNIWNIFSLPKFYIVHSSQGLLLLLWGRSLPCRWWADRQALVHWQWDSGNDDLTVTVLSLSPPGHPLLHCWTCWTLHPGHCGELSNIWQPDCQHQHGPGCGEHREASWRISQESFKHQP